VDHDDAMRLAWTPAGLVDPSYFDSEPELMDDVAADPKAPTRVTLVSGVGQWWVIGQTEIDAA
jgi:hypothetical protein